MEALNALSMAFLLCRPQHPHENVVGSGSSSALRGDSAAGQVFLELLTLNNSCPFTGHEKRSSQ